MPVTNLGHRVARSTIDAVLHAEGIGPVPECPMLWRTFLAAHWGAIAAADFFNHEDLDGPGPCDLLHAVRHRPRLTADADRRSRKTDPEGKVSGVVDRTRGQAFVGDHCPLSRECENGD